MPGYRNPDRQRIQTQAGTIFQYAGQTATWRDYSSASAGVSVAGFGSTPFYRQQTITALFRPLPVNLETQTPAGLLAATQFQVTTREQLGRLDYLIWKGDTYRVESDPAPATLPGMWIATVVRGYSAT